jgi:hypothetical protein
VQHAPRITDTAFEQAANTVCKQYVNVFDTATTLSKAPTAAESGQFLQTIATTFDEMVVKLSALPVTGADQAKVGQWLADWRDYDAYGHLYSEAVRNGAERDLVRHDLTRVDGILRRRNGFAKANHMRTCAFN